MRTLLQAAFISTVLCVASTSVIGCASTTEPDPTTALNWPDPRKDPSFGEVPIRRPDYDAILTTLATNRQHWRANAPRVYRFDVRLNCFCGVLPSPARITVDSGRVRSATYVDGRRVLTVPSEFVDRYGTIEALFSQIEAACAARYEGIDVHYDTAQGYPTAMLLDPVTAMTDDERELEINRLRRVE